MADRAGKGSAIARVRRRQAACIVRAAHERSERLSRLLGRQESAEMKPALWRDLMAEAQAPKSTAQQDRHHFLSGPEWRPVPEAQTPRLPASRRAGERLQALLQAIRKVLAALRGGVT